MAHSPSYSIEIEWFNKLKCKKIVYTGFNTHPKIGRYHLESLISIGMLCQLIVGFTSLLNFVSTGYRWEFVYHGMIWVLKSTNKCHIKLSSKRQAKSDKLNLSIYFRLVFWWFLLFYLPFYAIFPFCSQVERSWSKSRRRATGRSTALQRESVWHCN